MRITCMAVAAVCGFGSGAQASLIVNGGFEDPITFDGPPFVGFWEGFTSGPAALAEATTTMPRSGLQSLELRIVDNVNQFCGAFQDVGGLAAGDETVFSGWHKSLLDAGGIEIRIEWRDSVNDVEISRTANFAPIVGPDWEEFSVMGTVPAGADLARLVYAIQSFGGSLDQHVFVDDVSFVPAPGSVAALGCGVLLAGRRRR